MIQAIATLLVFQLTGELLARLSALPVPGPILGMVLLLLVLTVRGGIPQSLDTVSSAILRHLSLLFVPAGVGLMMHAVRIRSEWEAIVGAVVASTLLTLLVTAAVFRLCAREPARRAR